MAYQMEYERQSIRIIKRDIKKEAIAVLSWTVILVALALSAHFGGHVCHVLLTEKGQITRDAAEQLAEELQSGVPLQDAVQVFYAEIMQ